MPIDIEEHVSTDENGYQVWSATERDLGGFYFIYFIFSWKKSTFPPTFKERIIQYILIHSVLIYAQNDQAQPR